jgi:hypothetical protein
VKALRVTCTSRTSVRLTRAMLLAGALSHAGAMSLATPVRGEVVVVEPPENSVVALMNRRGLACTGTIIDSSHVLTARHCLPIVEVRVGPSADQGTRVRVSDAFVPPNRLDVAVLRLARPLDVPPILLADELGSFPKALQVGGFGSNDTQGVGAMGLRHFRQAALVNDGCGHDRAFFSGCRPGFELVIPRGRGRDTCQGDSGGPVLEHTPAGWRVIGVTSRAIREALLSCGDGGVYVRVDVAARWIAEIIRRSEKT